MDDPTAIHRYLQAKLQELDETFSGLDKQPDSPKRTEAKRRLGELRASLLRTVLSFPEPEQTHDS